MESLLSGIMPPLHLQSVSRGQAQSPNSWSTERENILRTPTITEWKWKYFNLERNSCTTDSFIHVQPLINTFVTQSTIHNHNKMMKIFQLLRAPGRLVLISTGIKFCRSTCHDYSLSNQSQNQINSFTQRVTGWVVWQIRLSSWDWLLHTFPEQTVR